MSGRRVYPSDPSVPTGQYGGHTNSYYSTGQMGNLTRGPIPGSQNYMNQEMHAGIQAPPTTSIPNPSFGYGGDVQMMTNTVEHMNLGPSTEQKPHQFHSSQAPPSSVNSRHPGVGGHSTIPSFPVNQTNLTQPPQRQTSLPPPPSNQFTQFPHGGQSTLTPPIGSFHPPPLNQLTRPPSHGSLSTPPPSSVHSSLPPPPGSHSTVVPHPSVHLGYPPSGQTSFPPPGGHVLPPPPSGRSTFHPSPGQSGLPPPPSSVQSTLPPHPSRVQSGLLPPGQSFPPPPSSVQSTLPPPPVGQSFPSPPGGQSLPPPPAGGQSILPPPPGGQSLPPPPGGQSLPPPPGGQSLPLPPPPAGGQSLLPPPPGGQSILPPPPGGQLFHSLPPPPGGQSFPPPPGGQSSGTRSMTQGPQYTSSGMTSGLVGPPTMSLVGPPPHSQAPLTAPHAQRYPRSVPPGTSEVSTTNYPPGSQYPSYGQTQPPSTLMQKQLQLPELQPVNLLENRNILPTQPLEHPLPSLPGHLVSHGPDPGVFCCSMNSIPATSSLLNKMKLPLAIHIHPFKDSKAKSCPVINPSVIVRCRVCRSYINPYVSFTDARHWRCNMCFRTNIVPEDYDYNPHSGKRGDRSHHTELKHSSVEYIAPSEYMVRPPQPSVYFFIIDVSYPAVESGLLGVFCRTLLDNLSRLPGDGRTMVGFLTYDHALHFYNLKSSQTQPQMLVVSDLSDVFIPSPHSLLVNLRESKELVKNLLEDLPRMFTDQRGIQSALGAALQVAEKLLHPIGGRITVLQSTLPNYGPGALKMKETSTSALKKDQLSTSASTDFYKKVALECSAQQIAVDLFVFSNPTQFIDLATISTVAKYSSGQIHYYPDFHHTKEVPTKRVERDLKRYLTRNIGFESVMRIRCTEGLSLHTFHGNFFVRSTDLLSLPNVNPDHGYCMNLAIDESLKDYSMVCFQAALLYTSYRGERRIRVHTLCLPVSDQLPQLYAGINLLATTAVLAKMGVDRVTTATLGDARDALLNTVQDATKAYRSNIASSMQASQFALPSSLKLLPLFCLSLLKHPSFTLNAGICIDPRVQAMNLILTLPLNYLLVNIYPRLYALHTLSDKDTLDREGEDIVSPPVLQLSAEKLSRNGVFLMDYGKGMYIWVGKETPQPTIKQIFGLLHFGAIPELMCEIPLQDNPLSKLIKMLIYQIRSSRQHFMPLQVIREDGPQRLLFINYLLEDKTEDGTSYYELLSHVARQLNK